jgi:DNA-binding CsgD family transcriptional regulator
MTPNLSKFESTVQLLLEANIKPKEIATILKKDIRSIYNTRNRIKVKSNKKEDSVEKKRGMKNKITKRDKRVIKRDILRSPKKTTKRLIVENNLGISKRRLQYFYKEEGATTNIATKKPFVSAKAAKLRLKYAKEQLNKLEEKEINLKKIIFSDESSIQRGHGARQEYYRKFGSIKAGQQLVSTTNKSKFKNISNKLFSFDFYFLFFYLISFSIAIILTKL